MVRFSANLGFLWADLLLPEAIRRAKDAGFDAVECHWPYDSSTVEVKSALEETGLTMLGLNSERGDVAAGEFGLTALPDRQDEAIHAIARSVEYALAIDAKAIHVMAGNAEGADAHRTFLQNLDAACEMTAGTDIGILIEPINAFDAPQYFLRTTDQARRIIEQINSPNLKLMFDCYHVARTEGEVIARLNDLFPLIGHVQFASVPDRGTPDHGDVDYSAVFAELAKLGWDRPLGAEYKSLGTTLDWMDLFV